MGIILSTELKISCTTSTSKELLSNQRTETRSMPVNRANVSWMRRTAIHKMNNMDPDSIRYTGSRVSSWNHSSGRSSWSKAWRPRHDRRTCRRSRIPTQQRYKYHREWSGSCSKDLSISWSRYRTTSTHSQCYGCHRAQLSHPRTYTEIGILFFIWTFTCQVNKYPYLSTKPIFSLISMIRHHNDL